MTSAANATSRAIRVLCVDDHRLVREGISLIIGRQSDMTVVGLAGCCDEAVDLFRQHRPDVTLMDLRLGERSGVEAIRAIRAEDPGARIVVLTMYSGDADIVRALNAGATAYVLKDMLSADLIRVVRAVYAGERPMSAEVMARLEEAVALPALTPRELQVLELLAHGLRNRQIGTALGISEDTVQVHMRNLLAKLDVTDRTAAVTVALRRGIIHL